jgi:hypothetical protein
MASSKAQELGKWLSAQIREKGAEFVQNSWEWALKHPAITKYALISGGFSSYCFSYSSHIVFLRDVCKLIARFLRFQAF